MVITSCTRNAVVRKGSWVRIPPLPPKTIPRKSRVYAGFLMPFCGALISHCGLKWCPELLKTYKKQREAIKRYCGYSSISLLFFLVFLFGLHHFLKRNFAGVGLYGRFPKQIFFVPAARPHTAPLQALPFVGGRCAVPSCRFFGSGARLPFGKVMAVCIFRTVIQFSAAVKEPFTYLELGSRNAPCFHKKFEKYFLFGCGTAYFTYLEFEYQNATSFSEKVEKIFEKAVYFKNIPSLVPAGRGGRVILKKITSARKQMQKSRTNPCGSIFKNSPYIFIFSAFNIALTIFTVEFPNSFVI